MDQLYRMILVDDEDEVRGRVSSRISTETGFEVVGTAGNGYDALDLIEEHSPHVVLTDIKMPYVDGIELATIIRRDYPTVKIGFITGYNEFDYAREAIKLRVHSYLTKPLTEETIRSFLSELKEELDDELENSYGRAMIQKQYEQSVPLLIEQCFTSLLLSRSSSIDSEACQLQQYGVDLDASHYLVCAITVERNAEHWDVIEYEKLKKSVRDNLEKALAHEELAFHTFFFNEGIGCIVLRSGELFLRELDVTLNQVVRTIEHFLAVRINIGVGRLHRGFRELRQGYEEAARALESGRVRSIGRLVYVDQLTESGRVYTVLNETESDRLYHALCYDGVPEVRDALASVRDRVGTGAGTLLDHRLVMIGIANVLVRYGSLVDADVSSLNGGDVLESITRMQSLDEFIGWAIRLAEHLQEYGERNRMDGAQRMLGQAIAYIQEHYAEKELTMQTVCDAQGISASYLGQLFKRYRNTTFVKFLTAVRMEKAKEKLSLSGSRIMEVAEACGYRDVYYFSHCFRKYAGVPPKQFRDEQS